MKYLSLPSLAPGRVECDNQVEVSEPATSKAEYETWKSLRYSRMERCVVIIIKKLHMCMC